MMVLLVCGSPQSWWELWVLQPTFLRNCSRFEVLSECQDLALKLWANAECKAMFPRGVESKYHTVTAEGQGLSWELKVAAQERQKLFLQEIEERFFAPLPPAGGRRHTGQKRKRTRSAQVSNSSNLAYPDSRYLQIEKKKWFQLPSTRERNSPRPVPNRTKCDTVLQFQAQEREIHQYRYHLNSAYNLKSNRLFQLCRW